MSLPDLPQYKNILVRSEQMDEIIVQFQKGLITKEEFNGRKVIILDTNENSSVPDNNSLLRVCT